MPVHKFITPKSKLSHASLEKTKVIPHGGVEFPPTRVGEKIFVYAQKEMKIGCNPTMIALGMGASIAQTPIFVSLPNELRHRRLGLINSIVAESCDNILVSIGLMPEPSAFGLRVRRSGFTGSASLDYSSNNVTVRGEGLSASSEPHIIVQKGTPLCILML